MCSKKGGAQTGGMACTCQEAAAGFQLRPCLSKGWVCNGFSGETQREGMKEGEREDARGRQDRA